MNVIEVWAIECPMCQKFEQTHVFQRVHDVLKLLPDVWWVSRQIREEGRPILTSKDGEPDKIQVYGSSTHDIVSLYDDTVYTPGLFLEDPESGKIEGFDPKEVAGADDSDILDRNPQLASRRLMKPIFRFYLKEILGLPYNVWRRFLPVYDDEEEEFVNVRPESRKAARKNPDLVYPDYDRTQFKRQEWYEAFQRARRFKREYAKEAKY